jgi:hypothetical protein
MSRSLCAVLLALTLGGIPATDVEAQNLVLSIFTDNLGVASPSGKHLYLSITAGGTMTYADIGKEGIVNRKRSLTSREFSELQAVFRNSKLVALNGKISGGDFRPRDYQMSLEVVILRGRERQEFTLVDYDRAAGLGIPAGAKELLCLVDKFRESNYRVSQTCNEADRSQK